MVKTENPEGTQIGKICDFPRSQPFFSGIFIYIYCDMNLKHRLKISQQLCTCGHFMFVTPLESYLRFSNIVTKKMNDIITFSKMSVNHILYIQCIGPEIQHNTKSLSGLSDCWRSVCKSKLWAGLLIAQLVKCLHQNLIDQSSNPRLVTIFRKDTMSFFSSWSKL